MKRIYFVRHGETRANAEGYLAGPDEPLSDTGQHQANAVAERTKSIDFELLFASDFLRAQQTAGAISEANDINIETNSVFGEVMESSEFFGKAENDEGLSKFRELRNENVGNLEWKEGDGEALPEVLRRVIKARDLIMNQPVDNVLVVSHALFIRFFAATVMLEAESATKEWLSVASRLKLSNTGISTFTIDGDDWRLFMWNDRAHFAE